MVFSFLEPSAYLFNYNNPYGACPSCEGFGRIMGISESKVIPDKTKSVYDGAVACWKGEKLGKWKEKLINNAHHFDFPIHRSFEELSSKERQLLWNGNKWFRRDQCIL